jgi:TatD DNase family protein
VFIDTHAHVFMPQFEPDRDEVIGRAKAAGIDVMVAVGYHLEASRQAVEVAQLYPEIYASIGVHPHDARHFDDAAEKAVRELASHPRVVAIGETGLDFFRDRSPRVAQIESFRCHIRVAMEFGLPLIVHDRDAHRETMQILAEERAERVVLHCFSGDLPMAEEAWSRGYYTSIAGPVTYPGNDALRDVVRKARPDRLVLETDCPFLPPQDVRGQRNEPAFILYTAAEVSRLLGVGLAEVGHLTTDNARRLFRV